MTTISHSAKADVPIAAAFAHVADYRTVPQWFFGITRFIPKGDKDYGLDAVFDAELKIGPKALTSVVQITEFEADRLITLRSIAGFRTSSRWEFGTAEDGSTVLSVEFSYDLPGGLAGKALGKIVEPFAVQAVKATDAALRRQLESAG
ncbi:SRPBCC family protein [Tsukamurella soli]|uniref:SRPBCC family protein n=1 Tax=Tsukamurella soli TaxID=644556 RepID=A0ABP8KE09_9ACTN